ncbi:MAG TPA: thiamine phosphate synthase [Solirubrobacteraceae bacterium]|nr:thiamine phosphate synthase [Solirubrobacteraceae bacterium]
MSPSASAKRRRERLSSARLYLVTDARSDSGDLAELLTAALEGGVDIVQLREKQLRGGELLRAAECARALCARHEALFIIDDLPALALAIDADGVHLGQEDMGVAEARALLGPEPLIGLSTHSAEQIEAAGRLPVDYIGVGPVFATPTKPGRAAVGTALVAHAAAHAGMPFFAIGGIAPATIAPVLAAGATRVAVVRAITDQADHSGAAQALRRALDGGPAGSSAALAEAVLGAS